MRRTLIVVGVLWFLCAALASGLILERAGRELEEARTVTATALKAKGEADSRFGAEKIGAIDKYFRALDNEVVAKRNHDSLTRLAFVVGGLGVLGCAGFLWASLRTL